MVAVRFSRDSTRKNPSDMRRSAIWIRYPLQEGKIVFSMIWRRDKRNGPEEFSRLTIVRIESENRHYLLWRNQGQR